MAPRHPTAGQERFALNIPFADTLGDDARFLPLWINGLVQSGVLAKGLTVLHFDPAPDRGLYDWGAPISRGRVIGDETWISSPEDAQNRLYLLSQKESNAAGQGAIARFNFNFFTDNGRASAKETRRRIDRTVKVLRTSGIVLRAVKFTRPMRDLKGLPFGHEDHPQHEALGRYLMKNLAALTSGTKRPAASSPLVRAEDPPSLGEFRKGFEKERGAFGAWRNETARRAQEDGRVFDPFVRFGDFFAALIFIEQRGYFLFDAKDAEGLFADMTAGADKEKYEASWERLLALNYAFVDAVARLESRMLHLSPLSFKDKVVVRHDRREAGRRSWEETLRGFGLFQVMNSAYWLKRDPLLDRAEIEQDAAKFMTRVLSRFLRVGYFKMPRKDFKGYPQGIGRVIQKMAEATLGILWGYIKVGVKAFDVKGDVITLFLSLAVFEALMSLDQDDSTPLAIKDAVRNAGSRIVMEKMMGHWLDRHDEVIKAMAGKIKTFSERPLRDGDAVAMSIRLSAGLTGYFLSLRLRLLDEDKEDSGDTVPASSPVNDAARINGIIENMPQASIPYLVFIKRLRRE